MTNVIAPTQGPINLPYTNIELTAAINVLPTPFGQLDAEGMFPIDPIVTPFVSISLENGIVTALPVTGDGPATIARHGSGDERIFKVPHIEHQDDVLAADIRGMLRLANGNPETLDTLVNKRLLIFKRKFALTLELMRTSSLKGVLVDGKGTVIYDLFAAFELTKKIVYFDLSNPNADIQGACDLVYALITQDLSDEVMMSVTSKVSRSFFNLLTTHPKVTPFYMNYQAAQTLANLARGNDGGYRPRTFEFGNIVFEEYAAVVPMWGGTNAPIIAANKGHAYPAGTLDSHVTYMAPPEDIRELDGEAPSITDWLHVTQEVKKHGKGVEILGQSDLLPMWRRPRLLVELDSGSGASTVPVGS